MYTKAASFTPQSPLELHRHQHPQQMTIDNKLHRNKRKTYELVAKFHAMSTPSHASQPGGPTTKSIRYTKEKLAGWHARYNLPGCNYCLKQSSSHHLDDMDLLKQCEL